jgi:hypothetical protein
VGSGEYESDCIGRKDERISQMQMGPYYFGGYYLIKLKPIDFGEDRGKTIWTCDRMINCLALDDWCISWMHTKPNKKTKHLLQLNDEKINEIQQWTNCRFELNVNGFPDLKMAQEYKGLFFKSINDLELLSINFPEIDANLLIDEFAPGNNTQTGNYNNGNFYLRNYLLRKELENEDATEEFLGYDFIGVECDGVIQSFYWSDITSKVEGEFNLYPNKFGLYDAIENPTEIRQFLNDPINLLDGIPYFIVKIKRVRSASTSYLIS